MLLTSISGIAVLLPPSLQRHPMNSGITKNLTFHIYEFGVVLLTFTFKRINALLVALIWKSAFSLGTQMDIKVGNFTIPSPNGLSSQNVPNLMKGMYFPGLKCTPLTPEPFKPLEPIVPSIFTPTLDSGGDNESDMNPI